MRSFDYIIINTHQIFLLPLVFIMGLLIGHFLKNISTSIPIALFKNQPIKSPDQNKIKLNASAPIFMSARYRVVEIITATVSTFIFYYMGFCWALLPNLLLAWGFILLIMIDQKHFLLPDIITLPLLWLGLFSNSFGLFVSAEDAILGAITAYLSLFFVSRIFKYIRGIEGLGLGDCKLFAVFGAWWGIHSLLPILLIASLVGSAVGIIMMLSNKQSIQTHIPFGPYLILSATFTCILR